MSGFLVCPCASFVCGDRGFLQGCDWEKFGVVAVPLVFMSSVAQPWVLRVENEKEN
jgi:hypothetical protein